MGKIKRALCVLSLGGVATMVGWKSWRSYILQVEKVVKFRSYYNVLEKWIGLKERGKSVAAYFEDNQLETIAIYGMGKMAKRLTEELRKSDKVKIVYAIDQLASVIDGEFPVFAINADLPKVDAIVVTITSEFDKIQEMLRNKTDNLIISLDEVVGLA